MTWLPVLIAVFLLFPAFFLGALLGWSIRDRSAERQLRRAGLRRFTGRDVA